MRCFDQTEQDEHSGGTHEALAIRAARRGKRHGRPHPGTIKRLPEKWSELFFGEAGELNGS